jgi:trigger factor
MMAKKKKRIKKVSSEQPVQLEENTNDVNKEEWHHVVTIENLGNLKRKLHIVYDTTAVGMAFDKSCELIGKRVQIKGFRRGKAPKPLIETYCREEIEKSASSMLTQEGFLHACFEQKIQPLGDPKTENAEFHIDGTFTCDVTLEIKPTIEATGYVGLQLTKQKVDRDRIRGRLLEEARTEHMIEVPLEEIKIGSVVALDFNVVGSDGEQISSGEDHHFMINEGQEPPFGENLVGKKVGDSFVENITLPENMESHGGESADVHVTIKSAFEKVFPSDEEFVKSMQAPSHEELMEAFSKRSEYEAVTKEMQSLEEDVITKLLELHSFDVPSGWVDDEEKYLISQLRLRGEIDESIRQHIRQMAERNVRRTFILEAVYDAEPGLRVTKEEFEAWIEKEATQKQVSPLVLKKELQDQNMLDGVFGLVKHRKVMDFIISQAQITVEGEEPQVNEPYEIPENPLE